MILQQSEGGGGCILEFARLFGDRENGEEARDNKGAGG